MTLLIITHNEAFSVDNWVFCNTQQVQHKCISYAGMVVIGDWLVVSCKLQANKVWKLEARGYLFTIYPLGWKDQEPGTRTNRIDSS